MQILLTEAEYNELKSQKRERISASKAELQRLCTLAAQHIPVPCDWSEDKAPRPWGCIIGPREQDPGYCDDCPVGAICPHTGKEWSQ